jgi:hypothetical protein
MELRYRVKGLTSRKTCSCRFTRHLHPSINRDQHNHSVISEKDQFDRWLQILKDEVDVSLEEAYAAHDPLLLANAVRRFLRLIEGVSLQ